MTNEVTVKNDALPSTFAEIQGMADAFVKSGMFTDVKQQAQAIVKIQAGRELGLPPVYSMQNINMIRDRLTTSANTIAMMVKRSGKYNYRIKEHTDIVCLITFLENDNGKWIEVGESKFTMEDAKRANLVKPESGWAKFPRAMLFSRAISQGARIYAPDAIGGIYTDEEIRSIPPRPEDEHKAEVIVAGKAEEVKETLQPEPVKELAPDAEETIPIPQEEKRQEIEATKLVPEAKEALTSKATEQASKPKDESKITKADVDGLLLLMQKANFTMSDVGSIMAKDLKWKPVPAKVSELKRWQYNALIEILKKAGGE